MKSPLAFAVVLLMLLSACTLFVSLDVVEESDAAQETGDYGYTLTGDTVTAFNQSKVVIRNSSVKYIAAYNESGHTSPWTTVQELYIYTPITVKNLSFQDCTSLTKLVMEFDYTDSASIQYGAFKRCTSLTEVSIKGFSCIQSQVFMNCSSLTKAAIEQTPEIWKETFSGCSKLETLDLKSTGSMAIAGNFFNNTGKSTEEGVAITIGCQVNFLNKTNQPLADCFYKYKSDGTKGSISLFGNSSKIKSITWNLNQNVPNYFFKECTTLKNVTITSTSTGSDYHIGASAFHSSGVE